MTIPTPFRNDLLGLNPCFQYAQQYGVVALPDVNNTTLEVMDAVRVTAGPTGTIRPLIQGRSTPGGAKTTGRFDVLIADGAPASGSAYRVERVFIGADVTKLQFGTAQARPITIGFNIFSSIAGTFGAYLQNAARNRSIVMPLEIFAGQQNTITHHAITFPGDTSGTWDSTTGIGLRFGVDLLSGSNFVAPTEGAWAAAAYTRLATQAAFMGTIGNRMELMDMCDVVGDCEVDFFAPPAWQVLQSLQRLYKKTYLPDIPVGSNTATRALVGVSQIAASLYVPLPFFHADPAMVSVPTVSIYSVAGTANKLTKLSDSSEINAALVATAQTNGALIAANNVSVAAGDAVRGHIVLDSRFAVP